MARFRIVPLTLKQANDVVASLHRHHKPVTGHRFSIGLEVDGVLVGAAIVGRPVARNTDQYQVAEVTRLVTDGSKNACSALYGASARVCREMGFLKIQTFTLESEDGASLRGSGWDLDGTTKGGAWGCDSRPRKRDHPEEPKKRWIKCLNP